MELSRREFSNLALLAAAGAVAGAPKAFARAVKSARAVTRTDAPTIFDWKRVGEGAHAAMGMGGNALVIISDGESMLIDTKVAGFGGSLRREAARFDARLARVVNTHHHADHTGGNAAFTGDLPVLAHTNAKPRVLAQTKRYLDGLKGAIEGLPDDESGAAAKRDIEAMIGRADEIKPEDFAPTQTIGNEHELRAGSETAELRRIGDGHTDNDVFLFFPKLNIVHTGDLLFHKLHPFMDVPAGATSVGWQASVRAIVKLCDAETVVIPGHGEVTDVSGLRGQIRYFDILRERVQGWIKEGRSKDEITAEELPELAKYGLTQLRSRNLAAVYDELQG